MIKTRQTTRKQISNLSLDIEIVNPIESKSLFGGCNYGHFMCGDFSCQVTYGGWTNGTTIYITGTSSSSGSASGMDNSYGENHVLNGGYHDDWNHNDPYYSGYGGSNTYDQNNNGIPDSEENVTNVDNNGDINGDGINDADMQWVHDSYPGDLSAPEALWLYMHPTFVTAMYNNQQLAFSLAPGHNGVSDALQHALWSALDAFDIGSENAHEFHTLHETTHYDINYPNRDVEFMSDLHNNGWGYNWAIVNGNPEANMSQFLSDFNAAVVNGHIDIVPIP